MIWKPKKIPTYDSEKNSWTYTEFTSKEDFKNFVDSMWSVPGQYNLKGTMHWRRRAIEFIKNKKRYCFYERGTEEYIKFWKHEKQKIGQGVIFDGRYVPGDYYFYLNYLPIINKIEGRDTFPDVWDSDYHFSLYCLRAQLRNLNAVVTKARQKGFEQPDSELVMSSDGYKPMGDIKVGDLVYTKKGTLTKVLEVFSQGIKDVYELTFLDGRSVRCGIDHLWEVYDKGGRNKNKLKVISLREMLQKKLYRSVYVNTKKGKKEYKSYRYCIPEINPIQYEEKSVPIPPYVLGCLLGDGSLGKQIRITTGDDEIISNILGELGEDYYVGKKEQHENHYRVTIKYKKEARHKNYGKVIINPLVRKIENLNLKNTNCYTKFIPDIYLKNSVENRISLLQGLMDTDGYINSDGYDIHYTTTSPFLRDNVTELCRSLGLPVNISEFQTEKLNSFWRIRIGNKISLFRLQRKVDRQNLNRNRINSVAITDCKWVGKESSSCILVEDETHTYLTRDFIPTHNSLKLVGRLVRNLWFVRNSVNKMLAYEEDFINEKGSWRFASMYRDFLNEYTPWYRTFEPDESLHWEQKKTVIEGTFETKKRTKGLRSKLVAATTKKNPAKAVGGGITELFCEESGIAPNLDKVVEFAEAATKMGGLKTGFIICSGAVGELKDAGPLEKFSLQPSKHGFLGVEDIFSETPTEEEIGFFVPDYWNYIADDPEKGMVKCYDEDGNSDIDLAKKYLIEEEKSHEGKDSYILWKSQHPWTLQDAFNIREDNDWPVKVIKEHQTNVRKTYTPLCVELEKIDDTVVHRLSHNKPIVSLRVDPRKDNRGVIEIDELPIDNAPYGLYYAGIDPIRAVNTVSSKSLMSVCIMKAAHYKDGKLVTDYPVARYTGRYPTWEETYEVCLNLCKFYNARIAVECNVTSFQEWVIREGESYRLMHRREIYIINELVPNSTIRDEIGIRMEGQFKQKAIEFGIAYVDEILSRFSDSEGNQHTIYGVSRLRDIMLMEEMLKFRPDLNTDRLIAFLCALMAARSNTNRNLIISEKSAKLVTNSNPIENRQKALGIPSPFKKSYSQQPSMKLPSPFKKR